MGARPSRLYLRRLWNCTGMSGRFCGRGPLPRPRLKRPCAEKSPAVHLLASVAAVKGRSVVRKSSSPVGETFRSPKLAAVDRDDVGEPQKDVREILGEDHLGFAAQGLAFFLIRFHMNL